MRVRVDADRCMSSGNCSLTAPDVFDQNPDDGVAVVRDDAPPLARWAAVRLAAARCAGRAIEAVDTP